MEITREQVLAFRVHAQELDAHGDRRTDAAILDLGVQDTGPDGAPWALALRGAAPDPDDLFTAWTLRGAPHVYRRRQAAAVARAVAPVSEQDAAKRVFDASRPLNKAGIPVLDALDRIAGEMRDIATRPVGKGEMSAELHRRLPEPYVRWCTVCDAEHPYEQPFRLSALQGGVELQAGTSPPVLQRIPGWRGPAKRLDPTLDVVRGVLRLLGPATPKQVADYVDAPVKDLKAHWPDDAVPVVVDGAERYALDADLEALGSPPDVSHVLALLGPFDLFLQSRDRPTVVPDEADRKDLWRTIGRPGGVLVGHEVLGSWRPRASGKKLRIAVNAWGPLPDLTGPAERLAEFRGVTFDGFVDA